jgi:hypothetical protein
MGGKCSAYGGRGVFGVLAGKPEEKDTTGGNQGVDGRIIFRRIFRSEMWWE